MFDKTRTSVQVLVKFICLVVFVSISLYIYLEYARWGNVKGGIFESNLSHRNDIWTASSKDIGPVDIVYTWVNGSDPVHQEMVRRFRGNLTKINSLARNRFEPWNNLLFSLRSVDKFVSWIRHVFIVTNGQTPYWLNLENDNITVVAHEEIFTNKSHLPTFSSLAIESHIHRIKGLSRHFIYMNDDFFFSAPVSLDSFYTLKDGYEFQFESYSLPNCQQDCTPMHVNNGECDKACSYEVCEFDGEDCVPKSKQPIYHCENTDRDGQDLWFATMLHTNYLLNKLFIPRERGIPVHAPMFIDKHILAELHERLPEEWDFTSSCQTRQPHTIQFPFAYSNFAVELSYKRPDIKFKRSRRRNQMFFLQNEVTDVLQQLPHFFISLVERGTKFANIADNMEGDLDENKRRELLRILDENFQTMFPTPSQYERA